MNYSLTRKNKKIGDKQSGEIVIARPQYDEKLSKDQFVKLIAGGNAGLAGSIESCIMLIASKLKECLIMGKKVDLGDLGEFFVKFDCKPLDISGSESWNFNPNAQVKKVVAVWEPTEELQSLKDAKGLRWNEVAPRRMQQKVNKACKKALTTMSLK